MNQGQDNRLLLFVVGDEPNSRRARVNLARILEQLPQGQWQVREVDVLKEFQEALGHKVFITPALVVVGAGSNMTIYGDLSNEEKVSATLQDRIPSNV
jgi:circadian clock protein KaiB